MIKITELLQLAQSSQKKPLYYLYCEIEAMIASNEIDGIDRFLNDCITSEQLFKYDYLLTAIATITLPLTTQLFNRTTFIEKIQSKKSNWQKIIGNVQ